MFGNNFSELFLRDTRPEKIYISNAHCACKPVKSEKCSDQMFGGFLLSIFVNSAAVSSSTEKYFMLLEQFFLNLFKMQFSRTMWKQEFVRRNHNKIQMTASVAPMKRCRIHKFHSWAYWIVIKIQHHSCDNILWINVCGSKRQQPFTKVFTV